MFSLQPHHTEQNTHLRAVNDIANTLAGAEKYKTLRNRFPQKTLLNQPAFVKGDSGQTKGKLDIIKIM